MKEPELRHEIYPQEVYGPIMLTGGSGDEECDTIFISIPQAEALLMDLPDIIEKAKNALAPK